jgi:hypothetical protein
MFKMFSFLAVLIGAILASFSNGEIIDVVSTKKWNAGKSVYKSGDKLAIVADDGATWQDVDGKVTTSARGYPNAVKISLRYSTDNANIMVLICCMNNNLDSCKNIGVNSIYTVPENGVLSCFANDNDKTYGNNIGTIPITVTQVPGLYNKKNPGNGN